jgi:ABC-type transport system substrate-binding protein
MTRGFLSSMVGIALLLALLLVTAVNVWQTERVERRQLDLLRRVEALEQGGGDDAGLQSGRAARQPSGGVFGVPEPDYVTQALLDPLNLLDRDEDPWLPAQATGGGTLYLHLGSDPKGFNYLIENGADTTEVQEFNHLQGLIHRHKKDTTKWGPEYAYSMVSPDDGLTYTFRFRQDFYWHEPAVDWASGRYGWLKGEHRVTAQDVVFFMDMLMNPQVTNAAPLRSYFGDLESYRAIDDFTFEIKFKARKYGQRSVALPSIIPLPKFLYGHDEDGSPFDPEILGQKYQDHWYNPKGLGCGPYKFVRFEPGVVLELERDPRWPLGGNAFDRVVYVILKDQNQPPRKLRTGELHLAYLQPGQFRTEFLEGTPDSPFKNGNLEQGEWWEHSWFYIGWNQRKPFFKEKAVRHAMSHAFNGPMLLHDVFMDLGEITTGPMPSFLPFYDKSLPPWPYDLKKAAALLDGAGWLDSNGDGIRDKELDGKRVEFAFDLLIYGTSDEYRTLGNIYKEDLAKIGVKMTVKPLEWSTHLKAVEDGEFDATTLAWVGNPDVDFRQIWHSSEADQPKSSNRIGFKNAEADRIIEALELAFDNDERIRLSHEFHRLLYEEQPYTFFFTRKRPAFWQKQLENVWFALARPYRNHKAWYLAPAG